MDSGRCEWDTGRCNLDTGRCEWDAGRCECDRGRCNLDSDRCEWDAGRCGLEPGRCKLGPGERKTCVERPDFAWQILRGSVIAWAHIEKTLQARTVLVAAVCAEQSDTRI